MKWNTSYSETGAKIHAFNNMCGMKEENQENSLLKLLFCPSNHMEGHVLKVRAGKQNGVFKNSDTSSEQLWRGAGDYSGQAKKKQKNKTKPELLRAIAKYLSLEVTHFVNANSIVV